MRPRSRLLAYIAASAAFVAAGASLSPPAPPKLTVDRTASAYAVNINWDPEYVMDKDHLVEMSMYRYVAVEGYLSYVANAAKPPMKPTLPRLEDDGDYHFSISSERKLRSATGGKDLHLLVCEISPQLRLDGCELLKKAQDKLDKYKKAKPAEQAHLIDSTFVRVRVSGYLRFGTEATHDGAREYKIGANSIKGHWEIHPVESVVQVDPGDAIKIGPTARFERTNPTGLERYSIKPASWTGRGAANYAHLKGTVTLVAKRLGATGDYDVTLKVTESGKMKGKDLTAVVPEYYVDRSKSTDSKIAFRKGTCRDNGKPLEAGQTGVTLYGLRSWLLDTVNGVAVPIMCPVERIK